MLWGSASRVRQSSHCPYTASLPASKASSPVSSTAQQACCNGAGRLRWWRCSRPMRCSSRSMGQSSVTRTSRSMSSDCSITCVPTTIRSFRSFGVDSLPMRAISWFSRAARSGIRNCAWNSCTSLSGRLSRSNCAIFCAFLTVFTITPAQPPSASFRRSSAGSSGSVSVVSCTV